MTFVLAAIPPSPAQPGWHGALSFPDGRVAVLTIAPAGDDVPFAPPELLDGLAAGVLPVVMRSGGMLLVRGALSHGALRQLTSYAEAWANWRPARFRRVVIAADEVRRLAPPPSDHSAVVAWSGGLRATHTLVRHLDGLAPAPFRVRGALRVLGLRHDQHVADADALDRARAALAPLGVPLVAVRTNAADAGFVDDEIGALPIVAAALHAVTPVGASGVHARPWAIAAQLRYPRPAPALPDLLGGDACPIRADGGATPPPQMARDVARHTTLAAAVSECRRVPRHRRGCGRCVDCTLTALAFTAAAIDAPLRPPRLARVATLPFRDPARAADATATLDGWRDRAPRLRAALAARVALARTVVELRDAARWLGSAAGLRPLWPR